LERESTRPALIELNEAKEAKRSNNDNEYRRRATKLLDDGGEG